MSDVIAGVGQGHVVVAGGRHRQQARRCHGTAGGLRDGASRLHHDVATGRTDGVQTGGPARGDADVTLARNVVVILRHGQPAAATGVDGDGTGTAG